MARLTKAHLRFLSRHDIDVEEAFDASGLKRAEYRERMKAERKFVAYGVTRCQNGHNLRNRYGNCIQCRPASIAFARRSELAGHIYVAKSQHTRLFKIGFSSDDPDNRVYIANLEGYGGASDWRICLTVKSDRAGDVELSCHRSLASFRTQRPWIRNGADVVTKETFRCGLTEIVKSLKTHLTDNEIQAIRYR